MLLINLDSFADAKFTFVACRVHTWFDMQYATHKIQSYPVLCHTVLCKDIQWKSTERSYIWEIPWEFIERSVLYFLPTQRDTQFYPANVFWKGQRKGQEGDSGKKY